MRKITFIAAALLAAGAAAGNAGTVEVKFIEPAKFTDIGRSSFNQKQHLDTLRAHFESLGRKLPASQKLAIEVTDVDLAGEERWVRGDPDVRVLRGRADWPRVTLRFTLSDGARTLQQGEATIADMNYQQSSLGILKDQSLPYERRMISRWFSEKIVAAAH
jgi:Protein of unknown function (DUF3016)